jgi:hypothetical protein
MEETEKKTVVIDAVFGDHLLAFKNIMKRDLTYLDEVEDISKVNLRDLCSLMSTSNRDQIIHYLPQMTKTQRQGLMDMTLWASDSLLRDRIDFWLRAFQDQATLEAKEELVKSDIFPILLQEIASIYSFDVKDPEYPDHDHFFTTEDDLLLFEVSQKVEDITVVKELIKVFYYCYGPEKAYFLLSQSISDSHLSLVEEQFNLKNDRLKEKGLPSDHEVIEKFSPFFKVSFIDQFIRKKLKSPMCANKRDDFYCAQDFKGDEESLFPAIEKDLLSLDERTRDFLKFDFINLLNASQLYQSMLRYESLESKSYEYIVFCFRLAQDYIKELGLNKDGKLINVFSFFNFSDLFKVGRSLTLCVQKDLFQLVEKSKKNKRFDHFGSELKSLLNYSLANVPRMKAVYVEGEDASVDFISPVDKNTLDKFKDYTSFLKTLILIQDNLGAIDEKIKSLNYNINEIDFEVFLITSLIHFYHYKNLPTKINALSKEVFLNFIKTFFEKSKDTSGDELNIYSLRDDSSLDEEISLFVFEVLKILNCKFDKSSQNVSKVMIYLKLILAENLNGYAFFHLDSSEWKHVGGILLA